MTTRKSCDKAKCGNEIKEDQDHMAVHYWRYMDGEHGREYDQENSPSYDFCSMECFKAWAASL